MNDYTWGLYLKAGGSRIVECFEAALGKGETDGYSEMICDLLESFCVDKRTAECVRKCIEELIPNWDKLEDPEDIDLSEADDIIDDYMDQLWSELMDANDGSEQKAFCGYINNIEILSTTAAIDYPELFVPYYFLCTYNVLEKVSDTFDLNLPDIPLKKDYKGRYYHYGNICKALVKYRLEQGWTPYELCAFLYDFAPIYIGGVDSYIVKDLPEPRSAFFIGGGGDNEDAVAEDDKNGIIRWQCNPDTRAGDMIVMYLRSPISAISSVWRACSLGFNDPFFYYYRCTYIGNPVKVKRMGIKAIKEDPVLSKMPIVTKNLQGINGVELKPSEYNHILDITKAKGVKKLSFAMDIEEGEYENEKAVEDRLIKPLLLKLGYKPDDYIQQLNIPVGNHNHLLIPDFILSPRKIREFYSCYAIVEAKRSIKKDKELKEALGQARSYALQLGAEYSTVASQEKIWVTSVKDGYLEVIRSYTWEEIKDDDKLQELRGFIGNRVKK